DLALIRIQVPEQVTLQPLQVCGQRAANRGEQVMALGFPLGDVFGSGLKLTTGVISATPEAGNNQMLILDARVNPGNSGGPLCDSFANVIGLVTAKSFTGGRIDSYGM